MGNTFSTKNNIDLFRDNIRPFDLVLFRGTDFVSDAIRWAQRKSLKYKRDDDFSHCGVLITSEVFDHPKVLPGKFYVLESTVSGRLGQGIPDIEGKSFLGVQIRNLEELIPAYLNGKSQIAIGSLSQNPLDKNPARAKRVLKRFFERNNHRIYDYNPLVLGSSVCNCLRPIKYGIEELTGSDSDSLLFCSEMACELYKKLGVLDSDIRSDEVVPMDFVERDVDEKIQKDFLKQIYLLNERK